MEIESIESSVIHSTFLWGGGDLNEKYILIRKLQSTY